MRNRRLRRWAPAIVVAAVLPGTGLVGRVGSAYAGSAVTVNTNAVAPGGVVEVSGADCTGTLVQITVNTAGSSIASQSTTPDARGAWLAAIVIPAVAAPGVYDVSATCRQANKEVTIYDPARLTVTGASTGSGPGLGDPGQLSTKLFLAALLVLGIGVVGFVVERAMRPRRRRRAGVTGWSPPQPR